MSEMIDRVALAMREAMAKPHLDPWEHAARAAIQAMPRWIVTPDVNAHLSACGRR